MTDAKTEANIAAITSDETRPANGGRKPRARKLSDGPPAKPARKPRTTRRSPKPGVTKTQPAKAKPAKAERPPLPDGYGVRHSHRSYYLVSLTDPDDRLVMCRKHGTTKPVKSMPEADHLGRVENRPSWCRKCKAERQAAEDSEKILRMK